MNLRRLLIFLTVMVALFGCKRSKSGELVVDVPAVVAAVVLGGGDVLLDPVASTALLVGLMTVRNETAVGTVNGDIEYRVDCPAGCSVDQETVVVAPGQEAVIRVFTTLVLVATVSVTVFARYVAGVTERTFPIAWNNVAFGNAAFATLALLSAPVLAVLWSTSAVLAAVGIETGQSNPLVPRRIPQRAQDVRMFGAVAGLLTVVQLIALFGGLTDEGGELFPEGAGPNGYTVHASPGAPLQQDDYITFWMSCDDDIPLSSTTEFYQYAFVCDSDLDPNNNWVPAPAFPDDFFKDTDRWYELNYAPNGSWVLTCKQIGNGNSINVVASGARAIISGDSIVMVVPRSEFAVQNPPFRVSTFAHTGDFGQNAPFTWSGDPTPTVAEGLHAWN